MELLVIMMMEDAHAEMDTLIQFVIKNAIAKEALLVHKTQEYVQEVA